MNRSFLDQPGLIAIIGAAVLGLLILVWPPLQRDTVADGLLPEGQRPRLLNTAAPTLEASAAARMIVFALPGAGPPVSSVADPAAAAPAAPAPPPIDLTPLLVGMAGTDAAPVGYFSSKGQTYRARRGEKIDGWTVVALSRRQARLSKGRRHLTTALFAGRNGALSPSMASGSPAPMATTSSDLPATTASAPSAPVSAGFAPPGVKKRKVLPPLPPGSKGYWTGPKGESPPPGYTRMPD